MAAHGNQVFLRGWLTDDPSFAHVADNRALCFFNLAVERAYGEDVDLFDVVAYDELAEVIASHKRQGDFVSIEGHLQHHTWESQDGVERSRVNIIAETTRVTTRRFERLHS